MGYAQQQVIENCRRCVYGPQAGSALIDCYVRQPDGTYHFSEERLLSLFDRINGPGAEASERWLTEHMANCGRCDQLVVRRIEVDKNDPSIEYVIRGPACGLPFCETTTRLRQQETDTCPR